MASDLHVPRGPCPRGSLRDRSPAAPRGFRILAAATALFSAALTACSGTDSSDPDEPFPAFNGDCTSVKAVPTFAELQQGLLPICLGCHSAQVIGAARRNAPEGLNFDTYELFSAVSDSAVFLVRGHLMPPPNGAGPTESQRNQLYAWAACGKPR